MQNVQHMKSSVMENDYGVGVSNRYNVFLEEDEDPLEMLRSQEQVKEAKKKTKVLNEKENRNVPNKVETIKAKPAAVSAPSAPVKKPIKETQNITKPVAPAEPLKPKDDVKNIQRQKNAPTVKFAPESREERNNRRNREERNVVEPREPRPLGDESEPRGNRGGRQRGSGGGRGRGQWRGGPKREFDRHSGSDKSGVKAVDKRDGGGAHNWGTYKDEINEPLDTTFQENSAEWSPDKGTEPPTTAPDKETTGESKENEGTVDGTEGVPTEDAVSNKEITLDEWKALRGSRSKPQFNIRKAGEGEDPSQWKKMYALNKKKEGEEDDDEEEDYELAEYPQRVGRQKHLLEIDIHFSDTRRGGRMRGNRGNLGRSDRNARPAAPVETKPAAEPRNIEGETPRETEEKPAENNRRQQGGGNSGGSGGGGRRAARNSNFFNNNTQGSRTVRGNAKQSAPKVDDEKDFPSLG